MRNSSTLLTGRFSQNDSIPGQGELFSFGYLDQINTFTQECTQVSFCKTLWFITVILGEVVMLIHTYTRYKIKSYYKFTCYY